MSPPAAYSITVAAEQLGLTCDEPARGWPSSSVLNPDGAPTEVVRDPVFNPNNFWSVAADFGWVAGAAMDPLTSAPKAAKAVLVDPGEFRALVDGARPVRPLVGRGFQARELKNRPARDGK